VFDTGVFDALGAWGYVPAPSTVWTDETALGAWSIEAVATTIWARE
jgi:hypothetical protein